MGLLEVLSLVVELQPLVEDAALAVQVGRTVKFHVRSQAQLGRMEKSF